MPKRNWSDEEKKAFGEKMKAARLNKQKIDLPEATATEILPEENVTDLQRQILEMKENMDLMRTALLNQNQGVQMDKQGELIGEFEKYTVDPANYPDPTERLAKEPRLAPLAFEYNYELEYETGVSSYETKSGKNIREPKFYITLNRIVLDDQGNQTPKRYIARKLIFHEDPQAALVIARDNGVEVNKGDERLFLNEMRYLRVRDWLLDIFFPKPADEIGRISEEVIGGTVVQVFTKKSVEPSELEFSKLNTKLRA